MTLSDYIYLQLIPIPVLFILVLFMIPIIMLIPNMENIFYARLLNYFFHLTMICIIYNIFVPITFDAFIHIVLVTITIYLLSFLLLSTLTKPHDAELLSHFFMFVGTLMYINYNLS